MPSPDPTMTLATDLRRLHVPRTAEDLNDLVARATQRRWSPTVLLEQIVATELEDRRRRSVERRLAQARLGRFKPMADWDWAWPTQLDRPALERILALDFLDRADNVLLVGAQGLGKTMIAKNVLHEAVLAGHTALFTTAADLLLDLNGQEMSRALERRLRHYTRPTLLAIDEVGYLAYDGRGADLLFQVVSRRYEHRAILGKPCDRLSLRTGSRTASAVRTSNPRPYVYAPSAPSVRRHKLTVSIILAPLGVAR